MPGSVVGPGNAVLSEARKVSAVVALPWPRAVTTYTGQRECGSKNGTEQGLTWGSAVGGVVRKGPSEKVTSVAAGYP